MPIHYGINANIIQGTAIFNKVASVVITFSDELGNQISFDSKPLLLTTVTDPSGTVSNPPYRSAWTIVNGKYLGVTITFSGKQTLSVDYVVMQF